MKQIFSLLLLITALSSCNQQDTPPSAAFPPDITRGVLILCEGNYNRGSGDIWFYDTASHISYPSLFRNQNGSDLGNVVQSIYTAGNDIFIVVNNSGKIVIVDKSTFKQKATVTGFQSPRYIIPSKQNNLAYVTDLYSGSISLLNLGTFAKLPQAIRAGAWTEQGAVLGNSAYVLSRRVLLDSSPIGEQLYTISTLTNTLVDSVQLGRGGEELVLDSVRKQLWLSYDHDENGNGLARLVRYDIVSGSYISIDIQGLKPTRLSISPDSKYLFFLNNGISYIKLDDPLTLQSARFDTRNWTSLKVISGFDGHYRLIACDSRDYNSAGKGYDFQFQNGTAIPVDSFDLGIIPGNIY